MSLKKLRSAVGGHLINLVGWKTDRKIIVIESDDWGSIRMPSKAIFERLKKQGIDVESDPFNRFDSLESEADLDFLFDLLTKFQDKKGNHPVITTNFVSANPDFEKIKRSGFEDYFFELINETYNRYHGCKNSLEKIKKGIQNGLLYPQFHGREHLNVPQWMRLLKNNDFDYRAAFDLETFAISSANAGMIDDNIFAAFDYKNKTDKITIEKSIKEGLKIFEVLFGFKPESFIAPCYVWDNGVEEITSNWGVKYIQTTNTQYIAGTRGGKGYKRKYSYIGKRNNFNQIFLNRNCYFEPSTSPTLDWVSKVLEKINVAFFWKKPAVISMHRLNFIGSIEPENRDKNLKTFEELLKRILKTWPDVEFLNSSQLGEFMVKQK